MKLVQLNLGCGKRYIPGFIHIDIGNFPHIDHRASMDNLEMFSDGTVDLIYCCHAFECFDRQEAPKVLREWHRVLKDKGLLRLAVPDFDALIAIGDLDIILGPLYGRMEVYTPELRVIYHKTVYDFAALKQMLESSGFTDVHRYDWRDTLHRDYDDFSQAYIPHMDKENGRLISLNVEAIKG